MTTYRFRFRGYKGLPTVTMTFRAESELHAEFLAGQYAYSQGYKSYRLIGKEN